MSERTISLESLPDSPGRVFVSKFVTTISILSIVITLANVIIIFSSLHSSEIILYLFNMQHLFFPYAALPVVNFAANSGPLLITTIIVLYALSFLLDGSALIWRIVRRVRCSPSGACDSFLVSNTFQMIFVAIYVAIDILMIVLMSVFVCIIKRQLAKIK